MDTEDIVDMTNIILQRLPNEICKIVIGYVYEIEDIVDKMDIYEYTKKLIKYEIKLSFFKRKEYNIIEEMSKEIRNNGIMEYAFHNSIYRMGSEQHPIRIINKEL